ncbi:SDR family NAD(P)-dependent oxidoreductase [Sciscionella marina]|uniref:SDR family NAD(P)-dependent oxidoreductase n=1 Tax=Sciscionella marina TaxID=508770 RepID=UPI00037BBD73|nr:SDR family oxidoreductase [Sciscionella marina]
MSGDEPERGRRVLVTGAASGIGRACALAFAEAGAVLGLLDRDSGVSRVLPSAAGHAWARADVRSEPEMRTAIAELAGRLGGIDAVIGCAGISGPFGGDIAEIGLDDWESVFAVNVTGQFLLVKHALPWLRTAEAPAIVFLGSDSAFVAAPGMVPYCAAKGALAQLTRALAVDLRADGIRVSSVCPSIVDTPLARGDLGDQVFDGSAFPVQRPEQVAAHVRYLASPAAANLSGVNLVADFGYLAQSSFPA